MLKRSPYPVQTTVLALALLLVLNSCQSQPQEGQTIQITPAHTQAQRQAATLAVQVTRTHTPAPKADTPTPERSSSTAEPPTASPIPSPTPEPSSTMTTIPTIRPTLVMLNSGLRIEKEVWTDVDLNCDGLEERLITIEQYSNNPAIDDADHNGTVGLALQIPAQQGYNQVWEYTCELGRYGSPICLYGTVKLLATGNCEQFIMFQGYYLKGEGQRRVKIFRWDGKDMSLVLDARGNSFEITQDPFGGATIVQDCSAGASKCRETRTNYVWNGAEFVQE